MIDRSDLRKKSKICLNMSAEQICEVQSQEVETFRETPTNDWMSDEDSSGESIGGMKTVYSCSDITEELVKNGDTLRRDPISLHENVRGWLNCL